MLREQKGDDPADLDRFDMPAELVWDDARQDIVGFFPGAFSGEFRNLAQHVGRDAARAYGVDVDLMCRPFGG